MNTATKIWLFLLSAAVIVLGVVAFTPATQTGAGSGSDHYFYEQFFAGLATHVTVNLGGVQNLSSATSTATISAAQVCSGDTINWNPGTNNSTATIDTSANLAAACLTNVGNSVTLKVTNTGATTTFNVAFPANYTIYHASGTTATTITSSTPAKYEIFATSIANTSTVSSTFAVYRTQFLTP